MMLILLGAIGITDASAVADEDYYLPQIRRKAASLAARVEVFLCRWRHARKIRERIAELTKLWSAAVK